jgi:hypothetical protein
MLVVRTIIFRPRLYTKPQKVNDVTLDAHLVRVSVQIAL